MTLFGPDLSRYQQGIDVAQIAAEGHTFVIGKVTQGGTYQDPTWPAVRDTARSCGLLLAGYHFITTDPTDQQAANCLAALGDPSVPLALDWETGSGTWPNFLATLTAFRAAGLHVALAYCPRWYWQAQGSPDMSGCGLPLWSSRYAAGAATGTPTQLYTSITPTQWKGYGGLQVALVQFTDRATIAGRPVDCSAFEGTRDQLAALLGGTQPAIPPITSQEVDPVTAIPITVRPDGTFRGTLVTESGGPSQVVAQAWLDMGSTWGGSSMRATALGNNGNVLAVWPPTPGLGTIPNNATVMGVVLPPGTCMVTVEGKVADPNAGTIPAASVVSKTR